MASFDRMYARARDMAYDNGHELTLPKVNRLGDTTIGECVCLRCGMGITIFSSPFDHRCRIRGDVRNLSCTRHPMNLVQKETIRLFCEEDLSGGLTGKKR